MMSNRVSTTTQPSFGHRKAQLNAIKRLTPQGKEVPPVLKKTGQRPFGP